MEASAVTTPIRSFLCTSSSPVAFAHSDTLTLCCCICDKLGGPAELHSGHGHGAQIHRWPNVCRSQGLHKHHCWEKVASPSLHTQAVPTLASLAFPGSKILQCIVFVLITRQRLSEEVSCMLGACNLAELVPPSCITPSGPHP